MEKSDIRIAGVDREALVAPARALYCTGIADDVEIDDNAKVSVSDEGDGAWVEAWIHVAGDWRRDHA